VTYERFRATVEAMIDDIPGVFLQELQGVHALRDAKREEGYEDVWRMGEYLDPGPEDFLGGSDGLGRHVALYYGSFRRIASGDPDFDWEEEIWETLTHELQHHVESLAGDGRLIEQDLLDAQAFERADGGGRSSRADDASFGADHASGDAAGNAVGDGHGDAARSGDAGDGQGGDVGGDVGGGLGGLLRRVFGGGRS
jgi:hypothetical protein